MKKAILSSVFMAVCLLLSAQVPESFSYQVVVRDGVSNNPLTNQDVSFKMIILKGSTSGTEEYTEYHASNTGALGIVTLVIGNGTDKTGTISGIDWGADTYYLKVEVDKTGGTTFVEMGTTQLLSVPYALNAKTADNAYWVKNGNDLSYTMGKVGIGTNTPLYSLDVSGSNQYGISLIKENTLPHTGVHEAILYIANNSNNASSQANISFAAGNPGHGRGIISASHDVSAGTYNGNLTLKVRNGSTSYLDAINIRSSGNVGINQTNPSTALDVNGVITATGGNFTGTTTVPTPVNETDAATKAYVDETMKALGLVPGTYAGNITDIDGNVYTTILIGTQTWMAQNLKTTKFNDGTSILMVSSSSAWLDLSTPGYCWYDNQGAYKDIYGALYNWYTVNTIKLCPTGWHVPTDAEWTTMGNYLTLTGFYNYDGTTTGSKYAKSMASTSGWTVSSTTGAVGNTDYPGKRNATGFTALPGGSRYSGGEFDGIGIFGTWWSATESDATSAWYRILNHDSIGLGRSNPNKGYGFSVRCIKDN